MRLPNFSRMAAVACSLAAALAVTTARAEPDGSAPFADAGSEPDDDGEVRDEPSARVGVQGFWAQGKVMPGVVFGARFGVVELDLEASLLWLAEPAPPRGITHLGSELGAHLMFLPVRQRHFDLGLGLGGDLYWLWNVHGDAVEAALALKAAANVWVTPELGVFATARAYPLTSSGLELGTQREGEDGMPLLFSTGITWRL